jgi:phosphoribosyl-AMP cyclohydrolase
MDDTDKSALEEGAKFIPNFNNDGLIPAIASDHHTGELLMVAWMNQTALDETLSTSIAHFWSRSRAKLWRKGEESGNTLRIQEIRTDCDQDVLWLRVKIEGDGKACHTGRRTCFYRIVASPNGTAGQSDVRLVLDKSA